MRVVLTRKLAEIIDGIDLGPRQVGDVFDVSMRDAGLLVAEEWAILDRRSAPRTSDRRTHKRSGGSRSGKVSR